MKSKIMALALIALLAILSGASCSKKISAIPARPKIPIFNGDFLITHNQSKWGIVDKNGNVIVPFICDGIKMLSDSLGIAAVYAGSYSLETNVPRFVYCGRYFLFDKNGRTLHAEKEFSMTVAFAGDNFDQKTVLDSPYRYVPMDTISKSFCDGILVPGLRGQK